MTIYYHVSPVRNTRSILRTGLRGSHEYPVFVADTLEHVVDDTIDLEKAHYSGSSKPSKFAVFEINLPAGVNTVVPHQTEDWEGPGGNTVGELQLYQRIPASRIKKIGIYNVSTRQWEQKELK